MSADFLSQEEVDALLRGVTGESDEPVADEAGVEGVRPFRGVVGVAKCLGLAGHDVISTDGDDAVGRAE